jgi:hypothetical protein
LPRHRSKNGNALDTAFLQPAGFEAVIELNPATIRTDKTDFHFTLLSKNKQKLKPKDKPFTKTSASENQSFISVTSASLRPFVYGYGKYDESHGGGGLSPTSIQPLPKHP